MKLLVLSDIHGIKLKIDQLIEEVNPDFIILPGDLPSTIDIPTLVSAYVFGKKRSTYVKYIKGRFATRITEIQIRSSKEIVEDLVKHDIPILLIHGNTETDSTRSWLELYCHRYPNLYWLSDRHLYFEEEDILFVGHGWTCNEQNSAREMSSGEVDPDISKTILLDTLGRANMKSKYKILISHSPPYHTPLDYLPHKGIFAGSRPIREIMDSGFFDGVISGHLHESHGFFRSKKGWWGINAGAVIEDKACTIDLEQRRIHWFKGVKRSLTLSSFLYKIRNRLKYDS